MGLLEAILAIYPSLTPGVDFELQDDGDGPYISVWKAPVPKPTKKQLENAMAAVAAGEKEEKPLDILEEIRLLKERVEKLEAKLGV